MKRRIVLGILILLLIGLYFYADSLRNDEAIFNTGLCQYPDTGCAYDTIIGFIKPLLVGILSITLVLILLLFVRENVYKSWLKFAIWAIPIGIIILWIAPTSTPGGWISGGDFTKETASWGVSFLFLIISLVIIIKKSFRHETSE